MRMLFRLPRDCNESGMLMFTVNKCYELPCPGQETCKFALYKSVKGKGLLFRLSVVLASGPDKN